MHHGRDGLEDAGRSNLCLCGRGPSKVDEESREGGSVSGRARPGAARDMTAPDDAPQVREKHEQEGDAD